MAKYYSDEYLDNRIKQAERYNRKQSSKKLIEEWRNQETDISFMRGVDERNQEREFTQLSDDAKKRELAKRGYDTSTLWDREPKRDINVAYKGGSSG